jgi:hypothetical protein
MESKTKPPTTGRAAICLLLNVLILPGTGTLASGKTEYKRTGRLQLALSLTLVPLVVASALGVPALSSEWAHAWIANFMMISLVWSVWSAVKIFRESLRSR